MENRSQRVYNYTVLLEKEDDGGYHAFCPILKGCHSQGDSVEEAIANITEAIELYLESLIADNCLKLYFDLGATEGSRSTVHYCRPLEDKLFN